MLGHSNIDFAAQPCTPFIYVIPFRKTVDWKKYNTSELTVCGEALLSVLNWVNNLMTAAVDSFIWLLFCWVCSAFTALIKFGWILNCCCEGGILFTMMHCVGITCGRNWTDGWAAGCMVVNDGTNTGELDRILLRLIGNPFMFSSWRSGENVMFQTPKSFLPASEYQNQFSHNGAARRVWSSSILLQGKDFTYEQLCGGWF